MKEHIIALYKLDVIRQALNKDYKPSLISGDFYYPGVRFYKSYEDAKEAVRKCGWTLCGKVKIEGTSYYLVGGCYDDSSNGLGFFCMGYGAVGASEGLLCCKSKEIAQHMSKYFAKEIFDAVYKWKGDYVLEDI
jgi:hypothetical protein